MEDQSSGLSPTVKYEIVGVLVALAIGAAVFYATVSAVRD